MTPVFVANSRCECQASLSAKLTIERFVVSGSAFRDGKRIASLDPGHSQTLRWEDDRHLVWTDYRKASGVGRHALVRCSLTGGCQRITDYVKRNEFSFPAP